MKCPKCGFENSDDSLFCEECGEKFDVQKFACPGCGAEVRKGAKHCGKCGHNLAWVDVDYNDIPIPMKDSQVSKPVTKNEVTTKSAPKTKVDIFKIIRLSVLCLGVFFIFIGLFGAFVSTTGSHGSTAESKDFYPIPYLFGDVFKEIKTYKDAGANQFYTTYLLIAVSTLISYLVMLIGTPIFAGLSIYQEAKNFTKPDFKNKKIIGIIAFALPFFFFTLITFVTTSKQRGITIATSLGWGSVLNIIGLFFVALSYVLSLIDVSNCKKNVKLFVAQILSSVALVYVLSLAFASFAPLITGKNASSFAEAPTTYRMMADQLRFDLTDELSAGFGLAILGFVTTIISIGLTAMSVPVHMYKNSKGTTGFLYFTIGFNILGVILTLLAGPIAITETEKTTFGISWRFVLYIVLILTIIGLNIASSILKKQSKVKE